MPKTQKTPKGAEIPVPTRGEVYRDLEKVAKPQNVQGHRSTGASQEGGER